MQQCCRNFCGLFRVGAPGRSHPVVCRRRSYGDLPGAERHCIRPSRRCHSYRRAHGHMGRILRVQVPPRRAVSTGRRRRPDRSDEEVFASLWTETQLMHGCLAVRRVLCGACSAQSGVDFPCQAPPLISNTGCSYGLKVSGAFQARYLSSISTNSQAESEIFLGRCWPPGINMASPALAEISSVDPSGIVISTR